MAWITLDDQFASHPKVLKAGPLAIVLQLRALSYATIYLTDGFIPQEAVLSFLHGFTRYMTPESVDWGQEMIAAGLWERKDCGYQIHDYLKYQLSKEQILKRRQRLKASGQAGGQASAQVKRQASAQPHAQADATKTVKPTLKPNSSLLSPSPSPFSAPQEKEKGDSEEEKEKDPSPSKSSPPPFARQAPPAASQVPLSDEERNAFNPFASADWLASLPSLPAYRSLNVRLELVRAKIFIQQHPSQLHTKEFFTQWLDDALNHMPHQEVSSYPQPVEKQLEADV